MTGGLAVGDGVAFGRAAGGGVCWIEDTGLVSDRLAASALRLESPANILLDPALARICCTWSGVVSSGEPGKRSTGLFLRAWVIKSDQMGKATRAPSSP